jgi:tRNA modification GTPase
MPNAETTAAARDTIAAIATPAGRGGIGVVRVSGPKVPDIARALTGSLPAPRHARLSVFRGAGGETIDEGLVLFFPSPHSYTGEPVLELQGHGGPVVMHVLLGACLDAGARLAEPGEFTRRAFLEGRIDLAQAEAVADLIDAASRSAARSALRSLKGEFSAAIDLLVKQLVDLRALTEAMLDFPEEDVDALHRDDAARRLERVRAALDVVIDKSRQGSLLRSGVHVVLAGRPNVGKSSLLNRLAGEERAIVTPVAGTTRDALREAIEIDGVPLIIVDTAGLRESREEVERIGVERAQQEIAGADVIVFVFEAGVGLGAEERALLEALPADVPCVRVANKIDVAPATTERSDVVAVSAKSGEGLDGLRRAILDGAGWHPSDGSVFLARERHLRALATARRHLEGATDERARWELFAEELRLAQVALGDITGEFSADDLLGEIFARFCIGK